MNDIKVDIEYIKDELENAEQKIIQAKTKIQEMFDKYDNPPKGDKHYQSAVFLYDEIRDILELQIVPCGERISKCLAAMGADTGWIPEVPHDLR